MKVGEATYGPGDLGGDTLAEALAWTCTWRIRWAASLIGGVKNDERDAVDLGRIAWRMVRPPRPGIGATATAATRLGAPSGQAGLDEPERHVHGILVAQGLRCR